MRISVLGMGRMGSALATRLVSGGHDVKVWNRSPGKAGDAVRAGAVEVATLEEAAEKADVVLTMLADDAAVRDVVLGDGGLVGHLADAVYIDSSTISPPLADEIAGRLERYLAMPVMGSPDAVAAGEAALLLGGPEDAADAVEPVTRALTDKLTRFDRAAEALAAKVTGNFLLLAGLTVLAEAFEIARSGGLDDERIKAVFSESPLVAPGLRNRFDNVLSGSAEGWFTTELGAKDVGLALDLASPADLPVGLAVLDRYRQVAGGDLAGADVAAVGLGYRRRE
jgi:3-hydroxyisobutyrate dehydrogenase-like beta-hydroxyacid dehydrogenase